MGETMRAAVWTGPGGPETIEVRSVPRPAARDGWTLVRVHAAGLNRSELMTRQGHSPGVEPPRVLGIECVGTVAESLDPLLPTGATVAAVMGGMGRAFDGGYAQYALLPDRLLMRLETTLDWPTLGALPETFLTAYGSLTALGAGSGETLLVRGGSSALGLAAVSLARERGLTTLTTTRNPQKVARLAANGADHVVLDDGDLAAAVRRILPAGPHLVLDLVGAPTMLDSLHLVRRGGTVCMTGLLSGEWLVPDFEPVGSIPSGTKLTAFGSQDLAGRAGADALRRIVSDVEAGRYRPVVDRVFELDEVAAAHRYMEANRATGKVVLRC